MPNKKEIDSREKGGPSALRYPELPFLVTFVLTRVERSLFYPAVESIGANEIYTLCHDSRHRNPSIPAVIATSRLLPSERAALGQPRLATSGLAPVHALAPASTMWHLVREKKTYRTCEQPWQTTTVLACEKTVVMVKHPGHLTSMKKERGAGTSVLSLCLRASLNRQLVAGRRREGGRVSVRGRGGVEKVNCENLQCC